MQRKLTLKIRDFLPYLLLTLAVLVVYGNTFDNDPLYDDTYLILKNDYLRSWHSLGEIFLTYVNSGAFRFGQFYRPLQNVLYLIVYQIGGLNMFGFHLLNLGLHAVNACLVYALGRKLNFHPGAVFIAAALWAMHPIHTEAVTYMSGTADVLFTLFCLLGLVILLPDFSPRKFWLATPIFLLGLLSKEAAIIFPALVLITLYLTQPERLNFRIYLRTWPLWGTAAAYLAARFIFVPFHGNEFISSGATAEIYGNHVLVRICTFLAALPDYVKLILWPQGLHMDRNFPVYLNPWSRPVAGGVVLAALIVAQLAWGRARRGLPLSWGLLWFGCAQLPQSGILVPVNSLFLEHWMYLPSVGLFLGIAESLGEILKPAPARKTIAGVAAIVTVVLGVLTYRQNAIWRDPVTFYRNILDHGETSVRAHNNLAIAYMNNGQYIAAMEELQRALKDPAPPPETYQDIAAVLSLYPGGHAHIQEEIAAMKHALEVKPDFLPACYGLADLYDYLGDTKQASFYRQKAATIRAKYQP